MNYYLIYIFKKKSAPLRYQTKLKSKVSALGPALG